MKLGEWMTINEGINSKTIPQILQHHAAATEYASKSYKVTIMLCIFSLSKLEIGFYLTNTTYRNASNKHHDPTRPYGNYY